MQLDMQFILEEQLQFTRQLMRMDCHHLQMEQREHVINLHAMLENQALILAHQLDQVQVFVQE
jgi:hypothetical protein